MTKKQSSSTKAPNLSWLPAFFAGLCLGLFAHFIPGVDQIFEEVKPKTKSAIRELHR